MSPRKRVLRKVLNPPLINGFKPYGQESETQELDPINLLYEEYEAIRLSDYSALNHLQSSVMMGVSRPTFTRIYASALQKIAKAFVEGRQIAIRGGDIYFESNWYHCNACNSFFSNPEKETAIKNCSLCGSQHFYEFDYNYDDTTPQNRKDLWTCPKCNFERKDQQEKNCNQQVCPKCNVPMIRTF